MYKVIKLYTDGDYDIVAMMLTKSEANEIARNLRNEGYKAKIVKL